MRKKEREVLDRTEIEAILGEAAVCRIALSDHDSPYIVPVCFGYKGGRLYIHCAREGRKLDILRKNSRLCFEVDIESETVKSPRPCNWGMRYRSLVGFGRAFIIDDAVEKSEALDVIMEHYAGPRGPYPASVLGRTRIVRIRIDEMTGKSGRPLAGGGEGSIQL